MTVEANIRNDALEQAARLATTRGIEAGARCEDRRSTDPETGEVACAREERGGSCLCLDLAEFGDELAAAIRAAKTPVAGA